MEKTSYLFAIVMMMAAITQIAAKKEDGLAHVIGEGLGCEGLSGDEILSHAMLRLVREKSLPSARLSDLSAIFVYDTNSLGVPELFSVRTISSGDFTFSFKDILLATSSICFVSSSDSSSGAHLSSAFSGITIPASSTTPQPALAPSTPVTEEQTPLSTTHASTSPPPTPATTSTPSEAKIPELGSRVAICVDWLVQTFEGAPVASSEPGYGIAKVIVDDYMKNLCHRAPASEAQVAPSSSTHAGPAPSSSSGSEAAEEDREEEGDRAASYSPAWHGFYTGIPSQTRTKLSNDSIVQVANVTLSLNCSLMTQALYTGSTIFSLQFVYKLLNACVTSSSTFRKGSYIKDIRKISDIFNFLPYSLHFAQINSSDSMRLFLLC